MTNLDDPDPEDWSSGRVIRILAIVLVIVFIFVFFVAHALA